MATPPEAEGTRLGDFRSAAVACFDLTLDMPDGDRERLLVSILRAVSEYVGSIEGENDLRLRYEAGDFRSAFIRKDVKQILAGGDCLS
ncbi:hypothetical protein [Frankia sp. Cas4]|uniref:hypothetical protein n=1 Tax=Frankia sp. Cas4 TaxID=3073927 RepID=UPI002AD1E340|nr:hypothetical protein [Frankia sp. Cas4]